MKEKVHRPAMAVRNPDGTLLHFICENGRTVIDLRNIRQARIFRGTEMQVYVHYVAPHSYERPTIIRGADAEAFWREYAHINDPEFYKERDGEL